MHACRAPARQQAGSEVSKTIALLARGTRDGLHGHGRVPVPVRAVVYGSAPHALADARKSNRQGEVVVRQQRVDLSPITPTLVWNEMGSQLAKPVTEKVTERHAGPPAAGKNDESCRFAASGMQGLRREMEDAHCIVPSMSEHGLDDHCLVAIYDGHGGDATAKIAAETMLSQITRQSEYQEYCALDDTQREPTLLGRALRSAFLELDRALPAALAARQGDTSSGSTAVVVLLTPTHFVCASCGDSRAVIANAERTDGVAALSEDHKPSLPAEAARIEAAGGRVLMDRVDGSLAMSRALGDFELKDEALDQCLQKVSPEPTIEILSREGTDEALIVACDGAIPTALYDRVVHWWEI